MKVRYVVPALVATAGVVLLAYTFSTPSGRISRIGWINAGPAAPNAPNVAAFKERMRELGYIEGGNYVIDFRWGDQQVARVSALIDEILALKPDVIMATGGEPTVVPVKRAAGTTPVVFITGDPVAEGIVGSLARPGGNMTGFAVLGQNLEAKRLEVLRQMLPGASRVAIVWNPATKNALTGRRDAEEAAARLGIQVEWREARDPQELDAALASLPQGQVDGLLVLGDPMLGFEHKRIIKFASGNRIPAVYFWREFVLDGGLASYGTSLPATYKRAAEYVDLILKGAQPGDLPVQQPTTFELVVNRGTARSLGITIPDSLLLRATEIIE